MKHLLSLCCVATVSVFLAASAHADDNAQANTSKTNVFNADMSNPDLAAVITSFQDVCLPFITHKTELPQSLNMQHYGTLLSEQGYEFQSAETRSRRVLWDPAREPWKPDFDSEATVNACNSKKWAVFCTPDSLREQYAQREKYLADTLARGEIMGSAIPARYKTVTHYTDSYLPEQDDRMKITLNWNYASQNHPAKSCGIKLDQASISPESFEADFIEKDADWYGVYNQEGRWTQCSRDGADEFEFSAERKDGVLSLSVVRNDFYAPKLCAN